MNLKTATLCSLIGILIYTALSLFLLFFQIIMNSQMHQPIPFWVHQVFWGIAIVFFNGSIILFLAVLYSKQKK